MVQEYGRYFGMPTCCLRGGCLTGPNHSGVELHGFLSYLVRCNLEGREYKVFGYKGKQVRDNIHSLDVARFIHAFADAPRSGEVYNLGGGKANSCSILEAFALVERISGQRAAVHLRRDRTAIGDHICYYSDLRKMRQHYPALGHHGRPRADDRADRRSLAAQARFVRILVTGACGFVGSTLIRRWVEQGTHTIVGLDNFVRPGSERNRAAPARPRRRPSITPTSASRPTSRRCPAVDVVVDAAANPSVLAGVDGHTSSRQLVEHNLVGTVNVLEYCRQHSAALVMLSTSRVYSIPPLASLPVRVVDDAFEPDASRALPPGLTPRGRRRDILHGAAGLALRRDEAGERAAGARIRHRRTVFRCG